MNRILPLFDDRQAQKYLEEKLLPLYPGATGISSLKIKPYKKLVWETTYHVVVDYRFVLDYPSREESLDVVCTAHSEENRRGVYDALSYLWGQGFPEDGVEIPQPLFFDSALNGTFYRGLPGRSLFYYLKNKEWETVAEMMPQAARMFARLHSLPVVGEIAFNQDNARIRTVLPGVSKTIEEVRSRYAGRHVDDLEMIFSELIGEEEGNIASGLPLSLVHGDAHPDNIIRISAESLGLIDFADLCLADPARDLGTFLQQFDYKTSAWPEEAERVRKLEKIFMAEYLAARPAADQAGLEARISLYYRWTALRTSIYWFLRYDNDEDKAARLLARVGLKPDVEAVMPATVKEGSV